MAEMNRIRRILRIDNLEAQLVLYEIARVGFNAEIDSPQTTPERKAEAIASRDKVLIEWGRNYHRVGRLAPLDGFKLSQKVYRVPTFAGEGSISGSNR